MPTIQVIRSFEATIDDVKPGERSVISKIGGMAIDRHRTRITPSGIDLVAYRSNPIILHEHGRCPTRGTLPVGRNQWIKIDGDRMIAKSVFRDDPYSIELFNAYKDEWMRGWSINVISRDASPPTEAEMRVSPSLRHECDLVHRSTELVEYSTTSMPSHRDALTLLVSRGIWVPDETKAEAEKLASRTTTVTMPGLPESDDATVRTMTDSVGGLAGGGAALKPTTKDEDKDDDDAPDEHGKPRKKKTKPDPEDDGHSLAKSGVAPSQPVCKSGDSIESILRRIVKEDGKYYVKSEDGSKTLGGPYSTETEAAHRLGQIEYFKHEDKSERAAPVTELVPSSPVPDDPVQFDGHGTWTVRGLDGIPFDNEATARRALENLLSPTSFEAIFTAESLAKQERNSAIVESLRDEVRAIFDLEYFGKV